MASCVCVCVLSYMPFCCFLFATNNNNKYVGPPYSRTKIYAARINAADDALGSSKAAEGMIHCCYPRASNSLVTRLCSYVQFYTKCALLVLICAVLTAYLCSYNLQQYDATPWTPLGELTALPRPPDWIFGTGKGEKMERERKESAKGKERERKWK